MSHAEILRVILVFVLRLDRPCTAHGQEGHRGPPPLPSLRPPARAPSTACALRDFQDLAREGLPSVPTTQWPTVVCRPGGAGARAPGGQAQLCRPGSDSARQEGHGVGEGACAGRRGNQARTLFTSFSSRWSYPVTVFPRSC